MRRLPKDFVFERYRVRTRLVIESDLSFILSLRADSKLSRFLNKTDDDIVKQQEWLKSYKEREQEGLDYYFIYYYDNNPYALNRIYNIHNEYGTGGSWLCKPGTDVENSIASLLMMRDILFEKLNLKYDVFDVRKGNKQVQKIHKLMGAEIYDETDLDYLFRLSREDYERTKNEVLQLLNMKE